MLTIIRRAFDSAIEVAAVLYSLLESAKLCGVEPKTYVLKATHAAIAKPGTVTLPHNIAN